MRAAKTRGNSAVTNDFLWLWAQSDGACVDIKNPLTVKSQHFASNSIDASALIEQLFDPRVEIRGRVSVKIPR
jgi:hypothetical protein